MAKALEILKAIPVPVWWTGLMVVAYFVGFSVCDDSWRTLIKNTPPKIDTLWAKQETVKVEKKVVVAAVEVQMDTARAREMESDIDSLMRDSAMLRSRLAGLLIERDGTIPIDSWGSVDVRYWPKSVKFERLRYTLTPPPPMTLIETKTVVKERPWWVTTMGLVSGGVAGYGIGKGKGAYTLGGALGLGLTFGIDALN